MATTTRLARPALEPDPPPAFWWSASALAVVLAGNLVIAPRLSRGWFAYLPGEPAGSAPSHLELVAPLLLPLSLLALAVALRGRTPARRVAAVAAVGLAAAVLVVGPPGTSVAIDLLVVVAWGFARRRGSWWYAALVLAPVLVRLARFVYEPLAAGTTGDTAPLLIVQAVTSAALVVAGLAAWGLDLLERRQPRSAT